MKQKILYFNMVDFDDLSYEQSLLAEDQAFDIQIVNRVPDSDILQYAADAAAIAVDYTVMTDEIMQKMPSCKVIVRRGIGFDNVDIAAATKNGIGVCNVPDYCQEDVALHTITLALSCARHVTELNGRMQSANGNFEDIKMHRLTGKTYGLLSFGNIPRTMVPVLQALGLSVAAWDPFLEDSIFEQYGVERIADMDDLLKCSDFLSIHVPLNPQTRNLINKEKLCLMKRDAIIVNTARGGIIDEQALAEAMIRGHISGVGLDVIADETEFKSPLQGVPNAILTPHVAYFTEESSMELRRKTFLTMYSVLKDGEFPKSLLNPEVKGN